MLLTTNSMTRDHHDPSPTTLDGADVLILTATKDERDVVLSLEADWKQQADSSDYTIHVRNEPTGSRWVLARTTDMGPEFAANAATRLVAFLKPQCIAMVGVCAGWREKVQLGDVIVAERLFRYDAGKVRASSEGGERREEILHDIRTYNLNPRWRQYAEDLPGDWIDGIRVNARPAGYESQEAWLLAALEEADTGIGQQPLNRGDRTKECPDWPEVVRRLETRGLLTVAGGLRLTALGREHISEQHIRYPDGRPKERSVPRAHVAPMATGSRVVEDMLKRKGRSRPGAEVISCFQSERLASWRDLGGLCHAVIEGGGRCS